MCIKGVVMTSESFANLFAWVVVVVIWVIERVLSIGIPLAILYGLGKLLNVF